MTTHGMKNTPEWEAWHAMRQRCLNPKNKGWKRYGGRGISVCPKWAIFELFLEDMGKRPVGMTLERIDNSKGYYPDNCRWATPKEQSHNRRNNKPLTARGKTMLQVDWAKKLGYANSSVLNNALKTATLEQVIVRRERR
jgi:hypothetical protein